MVHDNSDVHDVANIETILRRSLRMGPPRSNPYSASCPSVGEEEGLLEGFKEGLVCLLGRTGVAWWASLTGLLGQSLVCLLGWSVSGVAFTSSTSTTAPVRRLRIGRTTHTGLDSWVQLGYLFKPLGGGGFEAGPPYFLGKFLTQKRLRICFSTVI